MSSKGVLEKRRPDTVILECRVRRRDASEKRGLAVAKVTGAKLVAVSTWSWPDCRGRLDNRRAVPSWLYDFIPISCRRRPAPFWQNEIPPKNSVESRGCTYPKVTEAKLRGGFYLVTAGLAPAISIIGALCLPVRDRRDNKPGDDKSAAATSFAPLTLKLYKIMFGRRI